MDKKAREFLTMLMPSIRDNLKNRDMLAPVAFVFAPEGMNMVVMDTSSEQSKDMSAHLLRDFCEEREADMVVFLTESWSVRQPDMDHFMEWRRKRILNGSNPQIADYPHRIEVVNFSIETLDGIFGGSSEIKAGREIADPELTAHTDSKGRFSNFLAGRKLREM